MLEEPEAQKMSRFDPSVNSHRPASVKTQVLTHQSLWNISHSIKSPNEFSLNMMRNHLPFLNLLLYVNKDISHVLASIFKNVYTKDIIRRDTLSNLIKSKRGQSSHHERYVEELQQVTRHNHLHSTATVNMRDMYYSFCILCRCHRSTLSTTSA